LRGIAYGRASPSRLSAPGSSASASNGRTRADGKRVQRDSRCHRFHDRPASRCRIRCSSSRSSSPRR
jgi:hypothetical protein